MKYSLSSYLIASVLSVASLSAQYTDMINTNRPGVSQGAFSVGTNVLQFETGFSYGQEKHDLLQTETDAFTWDYAARYGLLFEELEVSIIGAFRSQSVSDTRGAIDREIRQSNFTSNTVGAKYLFYDPYRLKEQRGPNLYSWKANNRFQWSDLIPALSLYAGANFDFADNPFTPELAATISPRFILSTQNNLLGGFVLVTNIVADRVTTEFPTYGYVVTLTHATNDYFSIFVENQGFDSEFYADQLFRGGAAVLINPNLHVDASATVNFKDTPSLWSARLGVAYRFDMHNQDEFIEEKGRSGRKLRREKKEKEYKKKREADDDGDGGLSLYQ
jgi:hypothetical protein